MSLKAFHVVFIVCSIILSVFFGLWALRQGGGYLWTALVSFGVALGLAVYEVSFIKRHPIRSKGKNKLSKSKLIFFKQA